MAVYAGTSALAKLVIAEQGTLDAIRLATALEVGAELSAVLAYDRRLGDAARAAGLDVAAPGAW